MLKKIFKSSVIKNAGWIIGGKIFQMFLSLVVGILTARHLGPSNYGLINYAAAYTAFFTVLCTLGINSVIVKEFVDNPGKEGKILGTTLGLQFLSSLLSVITIFCISLFLDKNEPTTQLVVILYSFGSIFHIFDVFNYWFQSKLESKKTTLASLIAYIVTAVYKIILLSCNASVIGFAVANSIDYLCIAVFLLLTYIKDKSGRFTFSWSYGKTLLKKSYHYILPNLMVAIYAQTDKIMLRHIAGPAETGFYATASTLCMTWCFVLAAIIDSLKPPIMQLHKKDPKEFNRLNRIQYAIVFYVSVFVSIIFVFLGEFVIKILYGSAYIPAAAPLKIITWYTAFSYLGVARNTWIVCEEKQKYLKHLYIFAAIINVLLNLLLIPFWGAVGAALTSLISQILIIFIPLLIKPLRPNAILILEAITLRKMKK